MNNKRASDLTNVDLVTYTVAFLGGLENVVHLEEIAVKAYELRPGAFRWDLDQHSSHIDKDKVRVSLTDAVKVAAGKLVEAVGPKKSKSQKSAVGNRLYASKSTDLWRLTSAGSEWIIANESRIQQALGIQAPQVKKSRANQIRRQVTESSLYTKYVFDGTVDYNLYDFTDLLECCPDVTTRVIRQRFDTLRGQVLQLNDSDLNNFIELCGQHHGRLLEANNETS